MDDERVCRIQPLDVGSLRRAGQDVQCTGLVFEMTPATSHSPTVDEGHGAYQGPAMAAYGIADQPLAAEELDHLIPLELGGATSVANLWPEPCTGRTSAREKDKVENFLHGQVCSGKLALADAQQAIVRDWYAVYLTLAYVSPNSPPPGPRYGLRATATTGVSPVVRPGPCGRANRVTGRSRTPPEHRSEFTVFARQIKANRNSGIYHARRSFVRSDVG